MNFISRLLLAATIMLCALHAPAQEKLMPATTSDMPSPADRAGAQATLDAMYTTWNRHDLDAHSALMTEDCDWVNVVGMHWETRAQILMALRAFHATMFKNVSLHPIDAQITTIAPGVMLVVATFTQDSYVTPDGRHVDKGTNRLSMVMVERAGHWLIRAGHNTNIDPVAVLHDPAKRP